MYWNVQVVRLKFVKKFIKLIKITNCVCVWPYMQRLWCCCGARTTPKFTYFLSSYGVANNTITYVSNTRKASGCGTLHHFIYIKRIWYWHTWTRKQWTHYIILFYGLGQSGSKNGPHCWLFDKEMKRQTGSRIKNTDDIVVLTVYTFIKVTHNTTESPLLLKKELSVVCWRTQQFLTASDRAFSVGCEKSTFRVKIYEIYFFLRETCDSLNCCNTRFCCNMTAVSTHW